MQRGAEHDACEVWGPRSRPSSASESALAAAASTRRASCGLTGGAHSARIAAGDSSAEAPWHQPAAAAAVVKMRGLAYRSPECQLGGSGIESEIKARRRPQGQGPSTAAAATERGHHSPPTDAPPASASLPQSCGCLSMRKTHPWRDGTATHEVPGKRPIMARLMQSPCCASPSPSCSTRRGRNELPAQGLRGGPENPHGQLQPPGKAIGALAWGCISQSRGWAPPHQQRPAACRWPAARRSGEKPHRGRAASALSATSASMPF
ncbi:uncharacterized protein BDZ99DRAFT_534096 [Mytilinidion resinicola]|uniref:Uncharacterized protein n=1 Tax=Mytilinidion resinicola TaxID=574789 RepID=A0A6A6YJN0_9PEZI|nr:uncharacterized protein BDZ99DRAFT_534096 [Mytilinidion resinicola]KAF2808165.1 hypothetical protein BDZ99DRAFT_534096 [Mytilinidion resinicola]